MNRSTRRDRQVSAYVRRELYPHSLAARARIDAAAIEGGRVRSLADLAAVTPVDLGEVGDGSEYVVRPTRRDLMRSGSPYMRVRTLWASTWGRWDAFLATIEPHYRPVHFFTADRIPIGAAAADLVRLAGLGAAWMGALGVTRQDSVALIGGANAGVEAWQLSGGTRRAGISLAVVDASTGAARLDVSVVAGDQAAVLGALADGAWPGLRVALVLGEADDTVAKRLAKLGASATVAMRRAWAPTGTRAVWFECQGGAEFGWHTTPAAELVEVDEDGELLWTGVGWAGTVFLRLRTDTRAEHVDDATCPACGHSGPRLFIAAGRPSLVRWLRGDSRVADVRLTPEGAEVLPARAGANVRLVAEAKKHFPDQTVTILTKRSWSAP